MVSEACIKKYAAHKFKKLMNVENERVQDVSYYCEIDREILCRYRDKGQFPNPWQLVLIADHFGCSVNELLGFDRSKTLICIALLMCFLVKTISQSILAMKLHNA